MFEAQVNYDAEKVRLSVKLKKEPEFVENIRIIPAKVECILIQK